MLAACFVAQVLAELEELNAAKVARHLPRLSSYGGVTRLIEQSLELAHMLTPACFVRARAFLSGRVATLRKLRVGLECGEYRVLEFHFKREHRLQHVKSFNFVEYLHVSLRTHVAEVVEIEQITWLIIIFLVIVTVILPDRDCSDPYEEGAEQGKLRTCDHYPALGVQDLDPRNVRATPSLAPPRPRPPVQPGLAAGGLFHVCGMAARPAHRTAHPLRVHGLQEGGARPGRPTVRQQVAEAPPSRR